MIIFKVSNLKIEPRIVPPTASTGKILDRVLIRTTQDLVTGDEIISDSYPLKDVDDVVYEVDCKKVTLGGVNVDIGANASAEEAEETLEEGQEQVIDIVHSFRLNSIPFGDKKALTGQLKCRSSSNDPVSLSGLCWISIPQESG